MRVHNRICALFWVLQPADYGRLRTWASVAWVGMAPVAGWVNQRYGLRTGIAVYMAGSWLALPAAWLLPLAALKVGEKLGAHRPPSFSSLRLHANRDSSTP